MSIYEDILKIVGDKERVLKSEEAENKYLSDALGRRHGTADAIVFALSAKEVSEVFKYANERKIHVTPRGAGTNLVGSTVPQFGGIVIDVSRMNHILELDDKNFTLTVEPGVLLKDIQSFVEEKGFFYPPDPGDREASIGGNINTNAGGMRAVKYGVTRNFVRGLEFVLPNGDIIEAGSKNVKDSSGLSLTNFVIGSEGTLAIVTKCILRLIPKPEEVLNILITYPDMKKASESVNSIIKNNINPTAIEFIEDNVIGLAEKHTGKKFPAKAPSYLLIILDGNRKQIDDASEKLNEIVLEDGANEVLVLDEKDAADVWEMRGCIVRAVEEFSIQEPLDIVVPIAKIAEFIDFIHETEKKTGLNMITFGHAGDGNIHLCILREARTDEEWEKDLSNVTGILYKKAYEFGGLASGEHGIGLSKQIHYQNETPSENLALMNAIKKAFDPNGILNSKKSYLFRD